MCESENHSPVDKLISLLFHVRPLIKHVKVNVNGCNLELYNRKIALMVLDFIYEHLVLNERTSKVTLAKHYIKCKSQDQLAKYFNEALFRPHRWQFP